MSISSEPRRSQQAHFIHSIGVGRMQQFLAILRSFIHSCLLYTLSSHPSPPASLPSFLTSSCHQFFGLPLILVVSKFIYNIVLGILFCSILCTCPNQHNLCNTIASVMVGCFIKLINFLYWLMFLDFLFQCRILDLKFFYTLSFKKC
jgi:hypothetical protein